MAFCTYRMLRRSTSVIGKEGFQSLTDFCRQRVPVSGDLYLNEIHLVASLRIVDAPSKYRLGDVILANEKWEH
jgi:hypothetical protein